MTLSDLSPDALARLEAKLLADVEVVRRMRVLMEEYRGGAGKVPAVPAAPPVPVVPRRPVEEVMMGCFLATPESGFRMEDLRQSLAGQGYRPQDATLKTFVSGMLRQGKAAVLKKKKGRGGSLYHCTAPRPAPEAVAPADPETVSVSAAEGAQFAETGPLTSVSGGPETSRLE